MNILAVVGLLLLSLTVCYAEPDCGGGCGNECELDAATDTEWRVVYLGSEFDGTTTTFSYKILTLKDRQYCQDLSHWVLLVDCEACPPENEPSATCGRDGQRTLEGELIFGLKWEAEEPSTEHELFYTIIFPGHVNETTVSYIVKGSTRCAHGTIKGPDFSSGSCTIIDSPNEPEPECENDEDCSDDIPCTTNQCVEGECVYTADNDFCDDGISCTSNVCNPNATAANDDGCVISPVNSRCNDEIDYTEDACSPEDDEAGSDGCTHTPVDSECDDEFSCTRDRCNPDDVDAVDGCTHDAMNSECSDGFSCTADTCEPSNADADNDGCVYTPNDDVCEDNGGDSDCTISECAPDQEGADEAGCVQTSDEDQCDDGIDR